MRRFEEEFLVLNNTLLEMGSLVAQSIHRGLLSLMERNGDYAQQVLSGESRIDEFDIRIDGMAANLIALEQPVASDMRLVVAAIKISTDLERMGDLAVSIAYRSLSLMEHSSLSPAIDLSELAGMVESMVLQSLDSFVRRDAQVAHAVLAADGAVDALRAKIQRRVVDIMQGDSLSIERAIDHLIIARSLERIADHAKNIAEGVIFLVQGIDVRHRPVMAAY